MQMSDIRRELIWLGDSLKTLKLFPDEVKDSIGYALHTVQAGRMPYNAKPLKGFKKSVMEIISDYDKNTYRAVYTTKIGECLYVLHCFQKKSKTGIKTPKKEIDLIKQRLLYAENYYEPVE
jgi:phage-related protein